MTRIDPLIARATVRIHVVREEPNYQKPWTARRTHRLTGSGCIINERRIVTSAHHLANATELQVSKAGDSSRYQAQVSHVDHDAQIAIVTVEDASFFDGTLECTFGHIPTQNSPIIAYGFKDGSNEISVTPGSVTRVGVVKYTYSLRALLAIHTDARLDLGVSGGPVTSEGRFIGIAFESRTNSDDLGAGYVIPTAVIEHVLEDLKDGVVSGVPDLGIYWQKTENPALRAYLGQEAEGGGVMITRVLYGSSASGHLCSGDLIAAIDGVFVERDGTVRLKDVGRVLFSHLVNLKQVGDRIQIEFWRAGKRLEIELPLQPHVALVPSPCPARAPRFQILAGLVFMPLTYEYSSNLTSQHMHYRFQHVCYDDFPSPDRKEVVVLSAVLAHPINVSYRDVHSAFVHRVNHCLISCFDDLRSAFAAPVGDFHVIEIDYLGPRSSVRPEHFYGSLLVIDAKGAADATADILKQHGIPMTAGLS